MKTAFLLIACVICNIVWAQDEKINNDTSQQAETGRFVIHGQLENVEEGTIIKLCEETGSSLTVVALDTLRNGRFLLSDTISLGEVRKLYIMPRGDGFLNYLFDVWVRAGAEIKVTGHDRLFPLWNVESTVPEQQTANAIKKVAYSERLRRMQLMAEEKDWLKNRRNQPESRAKVDSVRKLQEPLKQVIHKAELEYLKSIPVDNVWIDLYVTYASLLDVYPYLKEIAYSLYPRLSADFLSTERGREITAYIYPDKVVREGDDMADGTLYDPDGNVHHLLEFCGQYILLDFWSQGCAPCIMSIPELERVAEIYRDKLAVVSICADGKKQWQNFVRERQLKGNQWNELVRGRTGLSAIYQVRSIPHYVLISPEGKVLKMWSGYGEGSLQKMLEKYINRSPLPD